MRILFIQQFSLSRSRSQSQSQSHSQSHSVRISSSLKMIKTNITHRRNERTERTERTAQPPTDRDLLFIFALLIQEGEEGGHRENIRNFWSDQTSRQSPIKLGQTVGQSNIPSTRCLQKSLIAALLSLSPRMWALRKFSKHFTNVWHANVRELS